MRSRIWLAATLLTLTTGAASAAPWDILPWFGGDGHRDAGTPIDMKLYLRVGGEGYEIPDSEAGLAEAEEIMARVFPGEARDGTSRMESSQVYQMLEELLTSDTNHAEALRVAGLNRADSFDVNLVLDDHTKPLTPGAVLTVPRRCRLVVLGCTETYTVREGDSLESVAEAFGISEEELRDKNKRALQIHPHARRENGNKAVYMGEAGLGRRSDDFDTFMHELGHVGDETSCGAGYGPDGSHRMSEILPPSSAFTEGWAQYQAAHLPGRRQGILADPPELSLETEVTDDEGEAEAEYVTVELEDRTLNDYLGNEARVGSILTALDALAPGREGVEAVFLETREDCRSVASIVGAYVEEHPELTDDVRRILRDWTDDVGSEREYEQVLAGILPRCLAPRDLPRSREYTPGAAARQTTIAPPAETKGGSVHILRRVAPIGTSVAGGAATGGLFGLGVAREVAEALPVSALPFPLPTPALLSGCDS